jgi:hypothetical protein
MSFTAGFAINRYTIKGRSSVDGWGTVTGTNEYNHGSSVTMTALPASGKEFLNWVENGVIVSTSASYTFTALADRELQANFKSPGYALTVTPNPQVPAFIFGPGTYNPGSYAMVTIYAPSGYRYSHSTQNGAFLTTAWRYYLLMNQDRNIVAHFTKLKSAQVTFAGEKEDGTPVSDARIDITSDDGSLHEVIVTGVDGRARTELYEGTYDYVFETEKRNFTGRFTVVNKDMSINVLIPIDKMLNNESFANIYPNPNDGYFTVDYLGGTTSNLVLEVTDITGKVVFRKEYGMLDHLNTGIDLRDKTRGIYFLRILENEKVTTFKVIYN